MTRITRLTIGALAIGAVLSPAAIAQAEVLPQPAPAVAVADGASTGSSDQIVCTILRLVNMNQGPDFCL